MVTCKHDLDPAHCADCAPRPAADDWAEAFADAEDGRGVTITARFRGTCRACGRGWDPGDEITYSEEEDGWCHSACAGPERA